MRRGALWGIDGAPERAKFQLVGAVVCSLRSYAHSRNLAVGGIGAGLVKRTCGDVAAIQCDACRLQRRQVNRATV